MENVSIGLPLVATKKQELLIIYKSLKENGASEDQLAKAHEAYVQELKCPTPVELWIPGLHSGPCPCCGNPGTYIGPQHTFPPTSTVICKICNLAWTALGYIGVVAHNWQGGSVKLPYGQWSSIVASALQHQAWYAKQTEPVGILELLAETPVPQLTGKE